MPSPRASSRASRRVSHRAFPVRIWKYTPLILIRFGTGCFVCFM
jgi:hypothetical protein